MQLPYGGGSVESDMLFGFAAVLLVLSPNYTEMRPITVTSGRLQKKNFWGRRRSQYFLGVILIVPM